MAQPDWHQIVLDPQWLHRLEKLARRRFVDDATAEEATTYVLEQLAEDDWARCRRYTGRSRPTTFLHSLASNLLEEFARKRHGRVRPPAWLTRQGRLWVEIWQRICLERALDATVVDQYCADGRHDAGQIRQIIRTIRARLPWCGAGNGPVPAEYMNVEGEPVSLIELATDGATPEDRLHETQLEELLALLAAVMGDEPEAAPGLTPEQLAGLRDTLSLSDEEILMLRMHFRDGLSHAAVARALGVAEHRPGRQIHKTLKRIRSVLERHGVALSTGLETLNMQLETRK